MGNINHYIQKIRKGDIYFDEAFKLSFILREVSVLHLIFCILFFIMGNIHLGVYNALVFVGYNASVVLVKKNKFKVLILSTALEVIFHGILCTILVGFGTGFTFYYFSMIPAVFYTILSWDVYKKKDVTGIAYAILMTVSLVGAYLISKFVNPLISIKEGWAMTFTILNIIMSATAMFEFLILLEWDVLSKSENLNSKNDELDKMANMDPLTKLYNRRYINGILQDKFAELNKDGEIFGVIIGDIDDFKKVNDTYGHDVGDDVLVRVAEVMKKSVRDHDYVCRWGGEEFLIIIAGNKQITRDVAERMRQSILKEVIESGSNKISITMTFGVTESIPGYTVDKLISVADEKLYEGKKNGKNQVVV